MADFEVLVEEVSSVEKHPNADRLSIVHVRGYRCVSANLEDGSPRYKPGDRVVYVPEGAVVPEWLLKKGFWNEKDGRGFLAGSKGDRVKAIKLRGVVSQGILFAVDMYDGYDGAEHFCLTEFIDGHPDFENSSAPAVEVGLDVTELLGITKYEPVIPSSMSGEAGYIGTENIPKFDIENIKKFRPLLDEVPEVAITEKIHGTCMIAGIYETGPDMFETFVTSKGLGNKGIALEFVPSNYESNLYVKTFEKYDLETKLRSMLYAFDAPVYILGEVYGVGVQDLGYSAEKGTFRVFDIFVGTPVDGSFLDWDRKVLALKTFGLEQVPVLYRGPVDDAVIAQLTDGKSILDGTTLREGVVITPIKETRHPRYGRIILKSVSEDYLLRKGDTTEFA